MKFLKCFLLITLAVTATKAASEELDTPVQEQQAQSAWVFLKDRLLQDEEIRAFADTVSQQLDQLDEFAAHTPHAQEKLHQLLEVVQARRLIIRQTFFLQNQNYVSCLLAKKDLDLLYDKQAVLDQETRTLLNQIDTWCEQHCEISFPLVENILNKCALAFDTLSECVESVTMIPAKILPDMQEELTTQYHDLPDQFCHGLADQLCKELQGTEISSTLSKSQIIFGLRELFKQEKLQFHPESHNTDYATVKTIVQTCVSNYCRTKLSPQNYNALCSQLIKKINTRMHTKMELCINQAMPLVLSLVSQAKNEADQLAKMTFCMKKYSFFINELLVRLGRLCNTDTEPAFIIELLPHIITALPTEDKEGVIAYLKYYIEYAFLLNTVDRVFRSMKQFYTHAQAHEKLVKNSYKEQLNQALLQKRALLLFAVTNHRAEFSRFLKQELASVFLRISTLTDQCSQLPENIKLIFRSFNRTVTADGGGIEQTLSTDALFQETIHTYVCENTVSTYLPQATVPFHEGFTNLLRILSDHKNTHHRIHNYGTYLTASLRKFETSIQKKQTSSQSETLGEKIVALADKMLPKSKSPAKKRKPKHSTGRGKPKSKKGPGKNKRKQQTKSQATSASKNSTNEKKTEIALPSKQSSAPVEKARSTTSRVEKQKRVWKQLFGCFAPTIRIIDQTEDTVIARCWRSFDSRDNVLILMRRSPDAQPVTDEDCTITIDTARLPKMVDTHDRGWDFFHTIPIELLEQFLPQLGTKHAATNQYLSDLGFDLRENTHALTIEAKLLRGHMVNPKADEFDALWAKPYGHTGAFIWGVNNDDKSVFHRFFHV